MKRTFLLFQRFCSVALLSGGMLEAKTPTLEVRKPVQEFIETTCYGCHGEKKQKGQVRLDQLAPSLGDPAGAQLWQDVLDVINVGDMPPEDEKYDRQELAKAVGMLTEDLLEARKQLNDKGGEVVIRRLTELEYINTLRVLTGIQVPEKYVPDDESGEDFNTLGRHQTFSPAMLEQYEEAAQYAVKQLLTPVSTKTRKVFREDNWKEIRRKKEKELKKHQERHERAKNVPKGRTDYQKFGFKNDADFKQALKVSPSFYIPLLKHYLANPNTKKGVVLYQAGMGPLTTGVNGEAEPGAGYIFRAKIAAEPGMPEEAKVLRLGIFQHREKKTLGYFHIDGSPENPEIIEAMVRPEPGKFGLQLGFSDLFRVRKSNTTTMQGGGRVPGYLVDWVEIEGPIFGNERSSRQKEILGGDEISDARVPEILRGFASRAFRGKLVGESFLNQLNKIYKIERESGKPPAEAIVTPLTMILSSPPVLYVGEEKGNTDHLSDTELATRLSYMLWKEPASDELLPGDDELLTEPDLLEKTIDSMMKDPRFDRFVREFFGQWLHLRKFDSLIFEKAKVAEFGRARKHFAKEQLYEFVAHVIREDLSLTNLIDSDFTMLNGTMATLYQDLEVNRLGDEFVRLDLSEANRHRGGLLGMSVIQAMGSTGEHTSPVERGAFILRKFLNSPPPPPPPNVPQLAHDEENLSIREKLAAHMDVPQCFSCHQKMDDMGLAMEKFDVIGLLRERDHGKPIKTAGKMHDGTPFQDYAEMKRHLLGHRDSMIESIVESLIAYSFGRESEFSDQDFIDSVVAQTKAGDYRFRALLKAFVSHKKFTSK